MSVNAEDVNAEDGSSVSNAEKWVKRMGGTPPDESLFPAMYEGMLDDYTDYVIVRNLTMPEEGSFVKDAEMWAKRMGGILPDENLFPSMYEGMLDDYANSGAVK